MERWTGREMDGGRDVEMDGGLTPRWTPGGARPPWWHQGQPQSLGGRGLRKGDPSQLPSPGRGLRGRRRSKKARRSTSSVR